MAVILSSYRWIVESSQHPVDSRESQQLGSNKLNSKLGETGGQPCEGHSSATPVSSMIQEGEEQACCVVRKEDLAPGQISIKVGAILAIDVEFDLAEATIFVTTNAVSIIDALVAELTNAHA